MQLDESGEVIAAMVAPVPSGWPQSAACAERLVLALVEQFASGPCTVISDCRGAIQEWEASHHPAQARQVWGGLWRQVAKVRAERGGQGCIAEVQKCKAHRSRAECEHDAQQLAIWRGNDAADQAAKQVAERASPSVPEQLVYEQAWETVAAVARAFGRMLALWPPARLLYAGATRPDRGERQPGGRAGTEADRGRHRWRPCGGGRVWQCQVCLCTTLQPRRRAGGCITALHRGTKVQVAAASAHLLGHAVQAYPSDGVLLLACSKCGAYAQRQGVKLARPCPG